jgi:16S rRNA (guanine966-N2)-methyltransferase
MKSQVRIIGGKWRGSKLAVVDAEGLRPTPDRIRETLFNWLAPKCARAQVLDCFAGSGVLGFEALSRGAAHVVALERQRAAVASIEAQADRFQTRDIEVIAGDACRSIERLQREFDIVFIDPPYAEPRLRQRVFGMLEARGCLRPGALVYFEWPRASDFDLPSAGLTWLKQKNAGQVNYAIAEWRLSG